MDDHNLNIYDFHARGYDPAIGRTWQVNPMADSYYPWSPYAWVMNNPLKYIDPTGLFSTHTDEDGNVVVVYDDGDLGVYRHQGSVTKEDVDSKHSKDNTSAGGEKIGRSIHTFSFANFEALEKGKIIAEGTINFESTWARDKIQSSLDDMSGYFTDYIWNANGNENYDIKGSLLPVVFILDRKSKKEFTHRLEMLEIF